MISKACDYGTLDQGIQLPIKLRNENAYTDTSSHKENGTTIFTWGDRWLSGRSLLPEARLDFGILSPSVEGPVYTLAGTLPMRWFHISLRRPPSL